MGKRDDANIADNDCAVHRWTTATRYYQLFVQRNLFGQWELVRAWGGRNSRLGRHLVDPATSRDDALAMLATESRRRQRRGYSLASVGSCSGGATAAQ